MRKPLLIFLSLFIFAWTNAFAQKPDGESGQLSDPDPAGVPMISYDKPKPYTINDVTIYGVKFINTDILLASAGLSKGTVVYIPGNAISQAVSRLWSQRYFSDVKVIAELDGDLVNLEVYLQERPRVYRWQFEGIRKGEATTLSDDMKLKRGTELSDYVLDKNINLIKKHYVAKGFRNVEVTPRIENDSVIVNAVNVTFVVKKNERVRIGAIDFEGNEEFTDKRLRRTMKKTHQKSINIFQNTKFNETEYENDKENILDFYNSKGHRNAIIVKDSIYVINPKRIGINLTLEEGEKFYIRNVSWTGNTKYSTEMLQSMFAVEKGDVYDRKTIHRRLGIGNEVNPDDASQITSMYQNEGYLMSMINPVETVVGADSIDLEVKVFEGRPFTINNVDISGNMRVDDEVIRREIYTRPGELYNRALVMQTLRQLAQMSHFDPMTLMPNIQPVSNELVDISWPLTETPSDKFEISGGWGGNMFVFSVGVQLNNLSLRNTFKKGAWRPYPQGQNQQLIVRAQSNGAQYKAFMGSFTEPWLGGKKPTSLTVSAYYSEETNATYFGGILYKANKYFRTTGVSVGIGTRLSWPDPYFQWYNELGYQGYNLKDWNGFLFTNGRSNIFYLRSVLARNTTNQPIYPSAGSDFSLSVQLTPPYSLLDGKDYKKMQEEDDKSRYKFIEFHKWKAHAKWYFPLSRNQKLVLMARAEMGYLGHYNKYKVSPFEGFEVGGDGMTGYSVYGVDVVALRGYANGTLNPYYGSSTSDYAKVYNKYTVEVRYPIIMAPQSQIYALVFAEGGNSFKSWQDFDPFTVKRSLGVGVRFYLPIVGMLGVDWGYGFDHPYGSNSPHGSQFHFQMGMVF